MHTAVLIFPHQLYAEHPGFAPDRQHILIEDPLFFGDDHYPARFHKQKLVMHRAAMKRFQAEIIQAKGYVSRYIDYQHARTAEVMQAIAADGIQVVHVIDPTDDVLERRLRRYSQRYGLTLQIHPSPNFLTSREEIDQYFSGRDGYFQTDFYVHQRRRLAILVGSDNKPIGGRWTYDTDNRQRYKGEVPLAARPTTRDNPYVREAQQYVERLFPGNPGETTTFIHPTSHAEASEILDTFLREKFRYFGPYQDAIVAEEPFVFHSLLSAALNSGLLSPRQVIDAARNFATEQDIPLSSLEGFIRQIVGWREFIRAIYIREGSFQRTRNFFGHTRTLDQRWYRGETGIPPVDTIIQRLNRYAYAHHIERLMVLGNFMLLCEINPDEVYRWFMEMFIDAYDWVMVPNVYGMSQYADGGLMTTKPYISSSNYIRKMSDYGRGQWAEIWDGLYWRFVVKHEGFFRDNPRLALMVSHLDRMDDKRRARHLDTGQVFLETL